MNFICAVACFLATQRQSCVTMYEKYLEVNHGKDVSRCEIVM